MKLFRKLASIYSGSYEEEPMRQYIKRWIRSSVPGVLIEEDEIGNMYITKGQSDTYPCVVAHLDQVQKEYPKDYKVIETQDIVFGYSPSQRAQCGLGADDKCGIWIALKMLKKHDAIKLAFFPGEEVGCVGSRQANMDFFNDVRFVVEPDRRGHSDIITTINMTEICSTEFLDATDYADFGYKPAIGMMTDVETLKHNGLKVSCINLSCGYYAPHTEEEYVVKADLINACEFVNHIIEKCGDVYTHEVKELWDDAYDCGGWGAYRYYGFGRSRRKSKKHQAKKDKEREEMESLYYEQYTTAQDYIGSAIYDDPEMTASSFLASYGHELNLLTIDDVEGIIESYRSEMMEEDFNSMESDSVQRFENQLIKEN